MRALLRVVVVSVALLYANSASAQAIDLSGSVTGPDGAAVARAIVRVTYKTVGAARVVVTDSSGRYRVDGLVPGDVLVAVERAGFRWQVQPATLSDAKPATLDFHLELAGVDETVVVTSAAMPQAMRETSKAVTTVDKTEIQARNEATLMDIVRFVPGVQVKDNGGPGQLASMRIRGVRSDATAVLVDGLRLRDAASTQADATAFLSNLNFIATDTVEVLRGSGSSLYGTNAVGGVVNLVSQVGGGPTSGEGQIEFGSLGQVRARGSVSGSAARNRLTFSGGGLVRDVQDGLDGDDASRSTGGQGTLRYQIDPRTSVSARFLGSSDRVDNNTSPTASGIPATNIPDSVVVDAVAVAPEEIEALNAGQPFKVGNATFFPGRNDSDSRRESSFQTIAIQAQQQRSSRMSWQASYQHVQTSRTHINGPQGPGFQTAAESVSAFDGDIDTIDLRTSIEATPWLSVRAGYEFEREGYADHNDDHLPTPDRLITETQISQRSHAGFAAAQISLLDRRLQISASGRAQIFRLTPPTFSTQGTTSPYDGVAIDNPPRALTGDVSAAYFVPASATKLRVHAGNAYRAPALYERFGGGFFADPSTDTVMFFAFGDPRLSPDRYRTVDGSVEQYLWGDRLLVSGTVFYIDAESLTEFDFTGGIDPATDPFGRSSGYINSSGGLSRGVELGLDARPSSTLRLQGSYTYTRAETETDVNVPGFFLAPGVFEHTATLVASHRWRDRLETVADLFHASAHYGAFFAAGKARAYRFPGFTTVGLTAAYRITPHLGAPVRIYVKFDNLFGETYYEGGWLGLGRTVVTGVRVGF